MQKLLAKIAAEKATIKKINFQENYDLKTVPEILKDCPQLETLSLSFTSISEIPDWVFQLPNLKKLSFLYMSSMTGEKPFQQPTGFKFAQKLEELEMQIAPNQGFPEDIFTMKNLKSLMITGEIETLPDHISDLSKLENLELFGTKISNLPKSVGNLKNLKRVAFYQSLGYDPNEPHTKLDLDSMFETLANCPKLKELSLKSNRVSKIPSTIAQLKSLQILDFNHNRLTEYPKELYDLAQLRDLDFGLNQLFKITEGVGKLKNLKTLKVTSNWENKVDCTALFNEIEELQSLETLELWSCLSVKSLPESISKCKKLTKIDVDNNLLTGLPESIFSMNQLKVLRVSTNQIPLEQAERLKNSLKTTKISV